jgi:hypothetical protein
MIIAQYPLRNSHKSAIQLNTIFGIRAEVSRLGGQKFYCDLTCKLIDEFFSVYYTDISKIWIKSSKIERVPTELSKCLSDTLQLEIESFTPDVKITFGKPSKRALDKLGINNINVPHPKAWQSAWQNEFDISGSESTVIKKEYKIGYILRKIQHNI